LSHNDREDAYIKHQVDVRVTRQVVEVFFQQYVQWNGERFVSWAETIIREILEKTEKTLPIYFMARSF
jgi:hypothetical protein